MVADFRALYGDATRRQHDAADGHATIGTAVMVTLDALETIQQGIVDRLHGEDFAGALQGLRCSEALLAGPQASASARASMASPADGGDDDDDGENNAGSWLHQVLLSGQLSASQCGISQVEWSEHQAEMRRMRKRQVQRLLDFEKARAAALSAQQSDGVHAPKPPPRRISASVQRRLVTPTGSTVTPPAAGGMPPPAPRRGPQHQQQYRSSPPPSSTASLPQVGSAAAAAAAEEQALSATGSLVEEPAPMRVAMRRPAPPPSGSRGGRSTVSGGSPTTQLGQSNRSASPTAAAGSGSARQSPNAARRRRSGDSVGPQLSFQHSPTPTAGAVGGSGNFSSSVTPTARINGPHLGFPPPSQAGGQLASLATLSPRAAELPPGLASTPMAHGPRGSQPPTPSRHHHHAGPNGSGLPAMRASASPLDMALVQAVQADRLVLQAAAVTQEGLAKSMSSAAANQSTHHHPPLTVDMGPPSETAPSPVLGAAATASSGCTSGLATPVARPIDVGVGGRVTSSPALSMMSDSQHPTHAQRPSHGAAANNPLASQGDSDFMRRLHSGVTVNGRPPLPSMPLGGGFESSTSGPPSLLMKLRHEQYDNFLDESRRHNRGRAARDFDDSAYDKSLPSLYSLKTASGASLRHSRQGDDEPEGTASSDGSSNALVVVNTMAAVESPQPQPQEPSHVRLDRLDALSERESAAVHEQVRERLRNNILPSDSGNGSVVIGPDGRPLILPYAIQESIRRSRDVPLLEFILRQPNAAEIVDVLRRPDGIPTHMTVEAWMGCCRIQRAWRSARAIKRFRQRQHDVRDYCEHRLPQLDALEVIVRILRGSVARSKYAAMRQRVSHVTSERVSLENKPRDMLPDANVTADLVVTESFAIGQEGGARRRKLLPENAKKVSNLFTNPFESGLVDAGEQLTLAELTTFQDVQRKVAARIMQRSWRAAVHRALLAEAGELKAMMAVATRRRGSIDGTGSAFGSEGEELTFTIPRLNSAIHSGLQSGVQSRRDSTASTGAGNQFLPLKQVKLSHLEALQRERDEAERLRRQQAEELLRLKLMRQREEIRRRTQATLLVQRVCRAYRRRLFLFAKKLSQGGGRFLVSANPFVRSLTVHHMRRQVPYGAHTEIMNIISKRSPHLVPELALKMEAERNANALVIQTVLRSANAQVMRAAMRRFAAARIVQRRWRLVRHAFRLEREAREEEHRSRMLTAPSMSLGRSFSGRHGALSAAKFTAAGGHPYRTTAGAGSVGGESKSGSFSPGGMPLDLKDLSQA